jgi:hypothetical protein
LFAWTNQSGSTLYIEEISPNGQFSGQYINRAQGTGCRNLPYPMTGALYGNAVTFTVKWQGAQQSCNSITSWTGFISGSEIVGELKISTQWQLVVNGSTNVNQIITGSDTFMPEPTLELKSLKLDP